VGKLLYSTICSLDGYNADGDGNFDWGVVDAELHPFVNELERQIGTYLYGRRMYETMAFWESFEATGEADYLADYARLWRAAEKVVFSRSLVGPRSERTRVEPGFDPARVRRLVEEAGTDVSIGGPELAALAFAAGLVDEVSLFVAPVLAGGGAPALPRGRRFGLELLEARRFGNGTAYLRYAVRS
jgi:dihydrofolate reductase